MTDMNNQYPGYTPPPEDGYGDGRDEAREEVRDQNRTLTTIATVLGVLLLIAAIIIGWMWATRDDDDSTSAAETTTTSTTPVETVTETSAAPAPEPEDRTVTNTVSVEETTQTITQQTTAAPPTIPAPAPGPSCDPEAFRADGHDFVDGLLFCDSGWARGGQDQSDYVRIFQWANDSWEMYAPAGESAATGYPCYDTDAMAAQGAPAALINQTLDCSEG